MQDAAANLETQAGPSEDARTKYVERRPGAALRGLVRRLLPPTLAIDLGSERSRIATSRPGDPIVSIPSAIAIDTQDESFAAAGETARRMLGRTPPGLSIEMPMQQGVIARPALAEFVIRQLMSRAGGRPLVLRPAVVMAAPAAATSVQRHALVAAARTAGAGRVSLIRESLAAALGAGLPVFEAQASLIIEMGAAKTEVAVISLGAPVVSTSVPVGGAHLSDAISHYLRRQHHLLIGRPSADRLKHEIAGAMPQVTSKHASVRGRDALRGVPTAVELKSDELLATVREVLATLTTAVHVVLEQTPPELSADVTGSGIHLSGGASRLEGLAEFMTGTTGLPAAILPNPELTVVKGCQRCAQDSGLIEELDPLD